MTIDQEEVDQHVDVEETRDAGIFGEVVVKDLKWIVTVILVLDLINQVKTEMDLKNAQLRPPPMHFGSI